MQRTPVPIVGAALLLAALAGFVDALAYTSLGGFFASFMSGNSTRLGMGLGTHFWPDVFVAGSLILSFVCGIIAAAVAADAAPRDKEASVMLLVTSLLGVGAALQMFGQTRVAILCLAAAMGAENGVFARNGALAYGLTYMTGNLVRFGQHLAMALMGQGPRFGWVRHLVLWVAFVAGVTLGAFTFQKVAGLSFWIAAIAAAALTLLVAAMGRRGILEQAQPSLQ